MIRTLIFVAAAYAMLLSGAGFAQLIENVPATHSEALGGFGAFQEFLDQHPQMRKELDADPNRINNPEFVQKHPELQEFYRRHPEVPAELQKNANDFIHREKSVQEYQQNFANFHEYLKGHEGVEDQLKQNPTLADDPKFLSEHPGLHSYLQSHPEVAWEMKRDPHRFFAREDRLMGESGEKGSSGQVRKSPN